MIYFQVALIIFQAALFYEYTLTEQQCSFKIDLNILMECLGIFGATSVSGQGSPSLNMYYDGYGEPLVLTIEEGACVKIFFLHFSLSDIATNVKYTRVSWQSYAPYCSRSCPLLPMYTGGQVFISFAPMAIVMHQVTDYSSLQLSVIRTTIDRKKIPSGGICSKGIQKLQQFQIFSQIYLQPVFKDTLLFIELLKRIVLQQCQFFGHMRSHSNLSFQYDSTGFVCGHIRSLYFVLYGFVISSYSIL